MVTRQRLVIASAIAIANLGCGNRPDDASSSTSLFTRDTMPMWNDGNAWHLGERPTLSIGGSEAEGEDALSGVVDAERLTSGVIVVASRHSGELKVFDRGGRFLRTLGGKGGGPGEFGSGLGLTGIWELVPDSVAVFDQTARRLTIFDDIGRLVRVDNIGSRFASSPVILGRLSSGHWVGYVSGGSSEVMKRVYRNRLTYLLFSLGSGTSEEIMTLPVEERFNIRLAGRTVPARRPFGRRAVTAIGAEEVYYGSADTFEIAVYSPDGRAERSIRKPVTSRPVSPHDIKALWEIQAGGTRGTAPPEVVRDFFESAPYPEEFPPYDAILVDAAGLVWVRHYLAPKAIRSRWSVFSREGHWLGDVTIPPDLEVYEIGPDFLLGKTHDALDAEAIVLYDLIK